MAENSLITQLEASRRENLNLRVQIAAQRKYNGITDAQLDDLNEAVWENLGGIVNGGGQLIHNEVAENIDRIIVDSPHLAPAVQRKNLLKESGPDTFAVLHSETKGQSDLLKRASQTAGKRYLIVSDVDNSYSHTDYEAKFNSPLQRLRTVNNAAELKTSNTA